VRRAPILLLSACTLRGDGEPAEETRVVAYFDAVEVFDQFEATLRVDPSLPRGDTIALRVRGDANAFERLLTGVHAVDTLSAGVDPNELQRLSLPPELDATVPALTRVYVDDDARAVVTGAEGEVSLAASARGVLVVEGARAAALTVVAAEAAEVVLAGEGPTLTLTTGGSARVDARGFAAAAVTVDAQGSGEVVVCSAAAPEISGPGAERVTRACE
jgi:hypothetical protein